jgi:Glyoxalase/Bleomycin resistance protein/Dioxygenase superfamily
MTAQHDFPTAGVELRHLLVVSDYARSVAFYRDVLGATVVREFPGTLCFLNFGGSQILLTVPGGPTQDKPTITFATLADADSVSSELAIRVPDCSACAGYLGYLFQYQKVNSHEEDSIATNLMRECKGKELVKPALALFWERICEVASTGLHRDYRRSA